MGLAAGSGNNVLVSGRNLEKEKKEKKNEKLC